MKVVWTEQAWERLAEIEEFIARDRPEAAANLIDKLVARGDALAKHPDRGRKLPEIPGSGLRELVVNHYRIVYRRTSNTIDVLTVFEGHRLLRREELPEDV
jgi:addiction module RelE/StbE family toxin